MQNYEVDWKSITNRAHKLGSMKIINLPIETLEGCPFRKNKTYEISECNNLVSLKGIPLHIDAGLYINNNKNLITLEYAPLTVSGSVSLVRSSILSFSGIGKKYLREINGYLYASYSGVKSHVLGLIIVNKLEQVRLDNKEIEKIINRQLSSERDLLECQEELISNGFKEYAKL